jgi:hypothetical protein
MSDPGSVKRDIGGIVIALILVGVGFLVLYDTTTYGDVDSAAFPRAVAIGLILVSALVILRAFALKPRTSESELPDPGSWVRRIALIVVMLGSVLLMAPLGFLPAMVIMFGGVLVVANYDEWNLRRAVIYVVSGSAVVIGVYAVFRYWLLVPLP